MLGHADIKTTQVSELGTADCWLSGILGAIPVGAAAYGKISEFVAVKGAVAEVAVATGGKQVGNLDIGVPGRTSLPRNGDRLVLNQGNLPTCGPTSCAMVLDSAGLTFDLGDLIAQSGVTAQGTTLPKLATTLNANGLAAKAVKRRDAGATSCGNSERRSGHRGYGADRRGSTAFGCVRCRDVDGIASGKVLRLVVQRRPITSGSSGKSSASTKRSLINEVYRHRPTLLKVHRNPLPCD